MISVILLSLFFMLVIICRLHLIHLCIHWDKLTKSKVLEYGVPLSWNEILMKRRKRMKRKSRFTQPLVLHVIRKSRKMKTNLKSFLQINNGYLIRWTMTEYCEKVALPLNDVDMVYLTLKFALLTENKKAKNVTICSNLSQEIFVTVKLAHRGRSSTFLCCFKLKY